MIDRRFTPAHRPDNGRMTPLVLGEGMVEVPGGYEPKSATHATLHRGGRSREVPVILKRTPDDWRYFKAWKTFRDAGLPVLPWMRVTPQGVLIPNLQEVSFYGKHGYLGLAGDYLTQRNEDHDKLFAELWERDEPQIVSTAMGIAGKATENRLLLPSDDAMELIVDDGGKWSLMILDLSRARQATPLVASELIEKLNSETTELFLVDLSDIAYKLNNDSQR